MVNGKTIEKPSPDQIIQPEKDGADEKVPEVAKEVVVKFEERKKVFEDLHDALKIYRGRELKLFQLEGIGSLGDKFRQLREALELGGATEKNHQDRLLESVIKVANKKDKPGFWQEVSNHSKMTAGSDLEEFYSFFIKGLKKQLEAEKQAKAA